MPKNSSNSLGEHLEDLIKEELKSGKYSAAIEVIHSALRWLNHVEKMEHGLIKALEKCEESGFIEDFDPIENLNMFHSNYF